MAPVTMKDDALPQIHLVRDTDLGVFAYELHILAGDFLRESEFNLRSLVPTPGRILSLSWEKTTYGLLMPCLPTIPQESFTGWPP